MELACNSCGNAVPEGAVFCSHCGKRVSDPPLSTSAFSQIWIYALSVLLPPLGLWPGIKYFKNPDPKAKQIGMIAIVLTVIATIVTLWATFALLQVYLNTLNETLNGIGG